MVADTSVILCVLLKREAARKIVSRTVGMTLIAPGSLRWEVGNALSSLMKRGLLAFDQARDVFKVFEAMEIQYRDVDAERVLELCARHRMYAYDAYVLECARSLRVPLLTLDSAMANIALKEKIRMVEV
jgi:predicted nucleic acid-binding protein